jgi:hypothetical protein
MKMKWFEGVIQAIWVPDLLFTARRPPSSLILRNA